MPSLFYSIADDPAAEMERLELITDGYIDETDFDDPEQQPEPSAHLDIEYEVCIMFVSY